ncbi:MAG TPA: hypothetical protein VF653_18750, partial [Methylomirabilota bacterium]
RYVTPGGRAITGHGIAPDVEVEGPAPDVASAGRPRASADDPALQVAFDIVKAATILQHREPGPAAVARETSAAGCAAGPA